MASIHQKGNGTDATNGDVPVVAPMNMGKGLLWDEATGTYYVALDERTFEWDDQLGKLKLRVSTLEDNQLRVRDDGIYQGNTAPPNVAQLYIDAISGDDSAVGSRNHPLRTLKEAFKRKKEFAQWTHSSIYLMEDQIHLWRNSWIRYPDFSISFHSYGPKTDAAIASNPIGSAQYMRSNEVGRATLKLICDFATPDATHSEYTFAIKNKVPGAKWAFNHIIIDMTTKPILPNIRNLKGWFGWRDDLPDIVFTGCKIISGGDDYHLIHSGGNGHIIFDQCYFDWEKGNGIIYVDRSSQMLLSIRANPNANDKIPQSNGMLTIYRSTPSTDYHNFMTGTVITMGATVITQNNLGV